MAGVAPNVTLVNLRAGQDSGYFFLQPSVDALTFAGDHGIDVVNMSYFIDPWLYNCSGNPADSATQQLEQRTIIAATTRALEYARRNGVTLIAAAGNEHTDMDHPTVDEISPDYPPGSEYTRNVDNSCLTMPTEGPNVVSVGAVGPSTMKADYSNWGQRESTSPLPAATSGISSGPPGTGRSRRRSWGPIRATWRDRERRHRTRTGCRILGVRRPGLPRRRPAPTTSTSRAPRWPRRTRSASLR